MPMPLGKPTMRPAYHVTVHVSLSLTRQHLFSPNTLAVNTHQRVLHTPKTHGAGDVLALSTLVLFSAHLVGCPPVVARQHPHLWLFHRSVAAHSTARQRCAGAESGTRDINYDVKLRLHVDVSSEQARKFWRPRKTTVPCRWTSER